MSRGLDLAAASGRRHWIATVSPLSAQRIALLLFVALGVFVLLTFRQYGISNDEEVQHTYGRLLLDFYLSGFADHGDFTYKNLYLYGGLFDLIAAAFERLVPMNVWDLRHLLSAAFGLVGLAGTWRLTRRLTGDGTALLAMVLLALTGAWTGAMFTHTKDVPFAATMVWALYFITCFAAELPEVRWRNVCGIGLALGCAFGLRVGAVFAVFYLMAALVAACWIQGHSLGGRAHLYGRAALHLLPAAVLTVALTCVFWPWVALSPGNMAVAMSTFAHFAFNLDTILNGVVMKIGAVPGTYLLTYLLVRLPELLLLGIALAVLACLQRLPALIASHDQRAAALPWLPLMLATVVPLAYTLLAAPPLYNGIRHFTFLLPPLAIAAAAGLRQIARIAARWPEAGTLAIAACLLLGLMHFGTLAGLHPYEYLEYNGITGGLRGAEGRWEGDYWASSLREAARLLNSYVAAAGPPEYPYAVAACAEPVQAAAWLAPGLVMTTDWLAADFFISPTQMNCHKAVQGRIVAEVVRDGVTIAVVRDRRAIKTWQPAATTGSRG